MKNLVLIMIAATILSACQQGTPEPQGHDVNKWYGSNILRSNNNETPGTEEIFLSCRTLSVDKVHHHYYVISAAEENRGVDADGNITYKGALFMITSVEVRSQMTYTKMLTLTGGDLTIVKNDNGLKMVYLVDPNQENKEIFTVADYYGTRNNQSNIEIPGLVKYQALECQK